MRAVVYVALKWLESVCHMSQIAFRSAGAELRWEGTQRKGVAFFDRSFKGYLKHVSRKEDGGGVACT